MNDVNNANDANDANAVNEANEVIEPVVLFGIPIDRLTMAGTLDEIGRLVRLGRERGVTHQVSTVNVDFLVNAFADADLLRILREADLCIGDGMPVVWASGRIGVPLPERVTGADLVPALAERAASTGWRVVFFGSAEGVAERASAMLRERHPDLDVIAFSGPMIRDVNHVDEAVLEQLASYDADILCVALGNPKQERFIAANRARLRTPVMIGIGGSLDMLVGVRKRAPQWVQRTGLEWIYRAAQEPRRLGKRYANDIFVFLPRLVRHLFAWRRWRDGWDVVATGPSTWRAVPAGSVAAGSSASDDTTGPVDLELDLAAAPCLNATAMGVVAGLIRRARQHGGSLSVVGLDTSLRGQLERVGPMTQNALATWSSRASRQGPGVESDE